MIPVVSFEQMTFENRQEVMAINLGGVLLMTHALLPLPKGRGWGRIVNIGSASVFKGVPGQTHYVAAKAGLIGFTRSWEWAELRSHTARGGRESTCCAAMASRTSLAEMMDTMREPLRKSFARWFARLSLGDYVLSSSRLTTWARILRSFGRLTIQMK